MNKKTWIIIIGWYGAIAILAAYVLLSFGVIAANSLWYQVISASGALGIIVETYYKKDVQPMVLNIIWLVIATITIIRILVH